MNKYEHIWVLIPCHDPSDTLIEYVDSLHHHGLNHILILDDGSQPSFRPLFEEVKQHDVVLEWNDAAMGKGACIKQSMAKIKALDPEVKALLTIEKDGRESLQNVEKLLCAFLEDSSFCLGCETLPENAARSTRLNLWFSSFLFKEAYQGVIKDVQSGLRVIPAELFDAFEQLPDAHDAYKLEMLEYCIENEIQIKEIDVEYRPDQREGATAFYVNKAGTRIYYALLLEFIKYFSTSLCAFLVDIILFQVFSFLFRKGNNPIFWATICARIISATVGYILDRQIVFETDTIDRRRFIKYIISCIIVMLCSAYSVSTIIRFLPFFSPVGTKVFVDFALFFLNYWLQKKWVFA